MHSFIKVLLPLFLYQAKNVLAQGQCDVVDGITLTAYGFPDASGLTAFGCDGGTYNAGGGAPTPLGDGSYDKPYAAAAGAGSQHFPYCSIIYLPYHQKYFRISDNCGACGSSPDGHVDLYLIQENSDVGQTPCELAFGSSPGHKIITNPPSDLPVNTAKLFEGGKCYNDPADGRVFPDEGTTCSGGGGGGDPAPAPAQPAPEETPQPAAPAAPAAPEAPPAQQSCPPWGCNQQQYCWDQNGKKVCWPPQQRVRRRDGSMRRQGSLDAVEDGN